MELIINVSLYCYLQSQLRVQVFSVSSGGHLTILLNVKMWNLFQVYSFDDDDYSRFMYFAFGSPSSNTILAATDTGYVLVVDTRAKR